MQRVPHKPLFTSGLKTIGKEPGLITAVGDWAGWGNLFLVSLVVSPPCCQHKQPYHDGRPRDINFGLKERVCMKCNLFLMNFLGIPSVCWRESRSPCRALWEVGGVSLSPHWPSFSDFSESFVQDWSPRTMGGCPSVYCVMTLFLSKRPKVIG